MKKLLYDLIFCFVNYVVAYIPCWHIRKMLYELCGLKIGKKSRINMRCYVYSPWKIRIGENTIINERCLLDGRGGLLIGNNCSISYNSCIYTASHDIKSEVFSSYSKETRIGSGVWICANSILLPGTILGDFVIIGANSVFKGKAEEKQVFIGNPATFFKNRDINNIRLNNSFYFR